MKYSSTATTRLDEFRKTEKVGTLTIASAAALDTMVPTNRNTCGAQVTNFDIEGEKRNEGARPQIPRASKHVPKFCPSMRPELNEEPVNAHLLTRSMPTEHTLKKHADPITATLFVAAAAISKTVEG